MNSETNFGIRKKLKFEKKNWKKIKLKTFQI